MAYDKNQNEFPLNTQGNQKRKSAGLLPKFFRTDTNKKFLASTVDQLFQPGVAEKISGYYGRKTAKAFSPKDNYIPDVTEKRENYQLEPSTIVKDDLDNVIFYKDYNDYINQISTFGGTVDDHSLLNKQEYYAWNPSIDWDKFTNFREYYWLPTGPDSVQVFGNSKEVQSTYTVTVEEQDDNVVYKFNPPGLTPNPTLKLYRGQTYKFEIDCPGYPIAFAISRSFRPGDAILVNTSEGVLSSGLFDAFLYDGATFDTGGYIVPPVAGGISGFEDDENISTLYNDGVTKTEVGENDSEVTVVYVEKGTIEFTVPDNAPDSLYYISNTDIDTSGLIRIFDILENTEINVEEQIIGKKYYTTNAGFDLSNGMKVAFIGDVSPEYYAGKEFFVEGVGEAIKFIDVNDLIIPAAYTEDVLVPFDSNRFDSLPYSNANSFAGTKDYIVINRASSDRNAWSRYNRWFHRSVVEKSAEINGVTVNIDQDLRAKRPIIEFESGLKLYKFGSQAKQDVDLVDSFTTDVFSTIEGSIGYNIDNVEVGDGMRILFTNDTDIRVNGKIYQVEFINHLGTRQIALREVSDTDPFENETVLVRQGETNRGKLWYYDGSTWNPAQEKTAVNQEPLFDIFDKDGYSYSDETLYEASTFQGNKIFSYKKGTGVSDTELGFALSYQNIENSGDILFDFNLLRESMSYQVDDADVTKNTDIGFLKKYQDRENFIYTNGWTKADFESQQSVIRQYVATTSQLNDFEIDVYKDAALLNDLWVRVYVNNKIQDQNADYTLTSGSSDRLFVTFNSDLNVDDVVLVKTRSATPKNSNGFYEFPYNLERNPKNENITQFTLGEVNDHVSSMIEDLNNFTGDFPGTSNLRDLGNLDGYGKKFIQHSGPINLPLYHITTKDGNVIKAIKQARYDYGKFKRNFLQTALNLGFDGPIKQHVDKVLGEMNRTKTDAMPYYFSDMLAYQSVKRTEYIVEDPGNVFFALTNFFTLTESSDTAVNVYLNGTQLLHGRDYTFNDEGFCIITAEKVADDVIELYEYESSNGSFIPPTPTKLGLYPKYEPQILFDDTYFADEPVKFIQGHDGSLVKAYDDYRDELLLELEKRIFNNIKQTLDPEIFDLYALQNSAHRTTGVSKTKIDNAMLSDFVQWLKIAGTPDYTTNEFYTDGNKFTYNYSRTTDPYGNRHAGFWRGIYKHFFDTDRPHTHPWEMLGFTIKPQWWEEVYGPAPYTLNNTILWEDLQNGLLKEPNKPIKVLNNFKRPGLLNYIPVDAQGRLVDPLQSGIAKNFNNSQASVSFKFGDIAPTEAAWRKSSEFPFSLITALLLNRPAKILGLLFDKNNIERNVAGQLVEKTTGKRIALTDLEFPNTCECPSRKYTSGLVNYIADYMYSNVNSYFDYIDNVKNIDNQIALKLAGFTDKSKFKLILDSRSPFNEGNVFVPEENYQIFLNKSSASEVVSYSGIIVEKSQLGYIVRGYDLNNPIFRTYDVIPSSADPVLRIGGVSEKFVNWNAGKQYVQGQVVKFTGEFYRVKEGHSSTNQFDGTKFIKLAELPIQGGATARRRKNFEKELKTIPYGTVFSDIQQVVDFMYGYEHWLIEQGFKFDNYNPEFNLIENFDLSIKEFLFWTTQNWSVGTVISVSPAASKLIFEKEYHAVDNIFDNFYDYSVYKTDGNILRPEFLELSRDGNEFTATEVDSADGIYALKVPIVQIEHVVLLDNKTVFNDVIYDPAPGYRQERIRVQGYRTDNWDGSLNIPGFIYDSAEVQNWQPYQDYALGDTVKYKEFFYSANEKVTGGSTFIARQWKRLDSRPEPKLITNLEYKTNQFADFYDLDTDNFDLEQQKFAQHLTGYQNRKYLQNIINDDVSQYKFYQGFIQDKGTRNSLDKLFDALSSANKESLDFFEEWAFKQGMYGATDGFTEVEYKLDETKFLLNPQPIELVNSIPPESTDLIYRILPFETYVKPEEYDHSPFPVNSSNSEFVKTSGFVHPDDVQAIVRTRNDVTGIDINTVSIGNYIWIGQDRLSWDVAKIVQKDYRIIDIADSLNDEIGLLVVYLNRSVKDDIKVGEIIGLYDVDDASGFYVVSRIENNIIVIENFITPFTVGLPRDGLVIGLESAKITSIDTLNNYAENFVENNDFIWLEDGLNQKVYSHKEVYQQKEILENPQTWQDFNYDAFGEAISTTSNNTVLAVGSPYYKLSENVSGVVNIYTRGSELNNWILTQTIEPQTNIFASVDATSLFGTSVAVSPDGKYLAVGSPNASKVLTQYKGDYSENTDYVTGEIVTYNDNLWKANIDIFSEIANIAYTSFDSYAQFAIDTDSTDLSLIVAGNYGLYQVETDHILVRAPADQYEGTEPGDTVVFRWNRYSTANLALTESQPFAGYYTPITADFISREGISGSAVGHEIIEKVDNIFNIDNYTILPTVGDTVYTDTGSAEVVYVKTQETSLLLYVNNTNGVFANTGILFTADVPIGAYRDDFYNTSEKIGGYWYINTSTYFTTDVDDNIWSDTGRGLVYRDVLNLRGDDGDLGTPDTRSTPNYYYNIQDYLQDITVTNLNDQISFTTHLAYSGIFDTQEPVIPSNLWVFRSPKVLSDTLSVSDTFGFYLDQLGSLDITNSGYTFETINKNNHEVFDLWDGYIDIEFTEFPPFDEDSDTRFGDPIQPVPKYNYYDESTQLLSDNAFGDTVQDVITGATAEVMYYQRFFNTVRLYVKNVTGTWLAGGNFGEVGAIQRNANATFRGVSDVDRVIGEIVATSLTSNDVGEQVGKLVVVQNSENFDGTTHTLDYNPQLTNVEYWLYKEVDILGIPREASVPTTTNNEWDQVFNLPADANGTSQDYIEEGLISVYGQTGSGEYQLINHFTLPNRDNYTHIGNRLRFTKRDDLYTLFAAEDGNGDKNDTTVPSGLNYGKLHIIKKGIEDGVEYTWDIGKDKNYFGEFSSASAYSENNIVVYDNALYRAITNISSGLAFDTADWEILDGSISRLGYVPTPETVKLPGEAIFSPENGILEFVRDFDVNDAGNVIATTTSLLADDSTTRNTVAVYREVNGNYTFSQSISAESTDGPGVGAEVTATLETTGSVKFMDVTSTGEYEVTPTVTISGDGDGATAVVELTEDGGISRLLVLEPGLGYTVAPIVQIETTDSTGTGAVVEAVLTGSSVTSYNVIESGSGYRPDTIIISIIKAPTETAEILEEATVFPILKFAVNDIRITNSGSNYTQSLTTATVDRNVDDTATSDAVISPVIGFAVDSLTLVNGGYGYDPEYTSVRFGNNVADFGNGNGASASLSINERGEIESVTLTSSGSGFIDITPVSTSIPFVQIVDSREEANFGDSISISQDGKLLAVGESFNDTDGSNRGKVYIYKQVNGLYELNQTLSSFNKEPGEGFGHKVSFDGNQLAVSSINADAKIFTTIDSETTTFDNGLTNIIKTSSNTGVVYIYERLEDNLVYADQIEYNNLDNDQVRQFGDTLLLTNNHIYVGMPKLQKGVDTVKFVDGASNILRVDNARRFKLNERIQFTFFDDSTDALINSGLEESKDYFIKEIINDTDFTISETQGGSIKQLTTNTVAKFRVSANRAVQGLLIDYQRPINEKSWNIHREPYASVDVSKFRGAFLYNTKTNKLLEHIDILDPVQGKIAGIVEQELDYKLYYDPALYNVINNEDVQNTESWAENYVGKTWWDLNFVRFYNPYQDTSIFQSNYWQTIFPETEVRVYEWIESTLTPDQWDTISGTEEAPSQGVSGTTRYGNSFYVKKKKYDSVAQRFTNKYYYWVENKTTIPNVEGRNLTVKQMTDLITNPAQQGYRFVALMKDNRFTVYNCNNLFEDKNVAINFRYWTIDDQEQNIHSQYQILSDGLATSRPNKDIEKKWFDSLIGYDEFDRPVPNPILSDKQKYGIQFKPRQSMFKNRVEALKQVIERVNSVLSTRITVDDFNLSSLSSFDPAPTAFSRLFDVSIETFDELQFIGTANLTPAIIEPVIVDGSITRLNIINAGRGYKTPPSYEIKGNGEGAEFEFAIDSVGKIISANVVQGGKNYQDNTTIDIRKFSVLVEADSTNRGRWVIYNRNSVTNVWERSIIQQYDVRQYWNYADWYADGYGLFTITNFEIDESYELTSLDAPIGTVVKINNIGSGGWLLLEKIANEDTDDYTVNYKTIGRENGTIQFSQDLYNFIESRVGFDATSFDARYYDNQPIIETRIILEALRDNILVDELAVEYNKLFFASIRYVFAEQLFVDWAFKTSFVKAIHNVGELDQRVNFKNDNLESYEDYIKEVKPFKTKVREYRSSYDKLDPSNTSVTDFDLPPSYSSIDAKIIPESIIATTNSLTNLSITIDEYPKKHWKDNVGFTITDVQIASQGSGYTQAPTINFQGGGGTGATAKAFVSNGKLTKIRVTNPGTGYLSAPRVIINGSLIEGGVEATASAIIGNSLVRSTHVRSKFDRVTGNFYITNLQETENFVGSGATTTFTLKWPLDQKSNRMTIYVDGIEALRSEYSFSNVSDNSKSYTRYLGRVDFVEPPKTGAAIEVIYFRDIDMLDAQDRINLFYNPTTGMIGNDVAQLMDGIDYGGVEVKSLEFEGAAGWDTKPWFSTLWDTYDNTFEDEIFTFDDSTVQVVLSKPLEEGISYNVYLDGIRIDDPLYDGSTVTSNPNAIMQTLVGDGITQTLYIDNLKLEPYDETGNNTGPDLTIQEGTSTLIIRKVTSDGSFVPDPTSYDTQLSGGNINYSTATGLNAEDIIVDGDGFVTPTTSKGPEELVPGQIVDTLDIRVYQRDSAGGSAIFSQAYITDGVQTVFDLGVIPNSSDAIYVRINNQEISQDDYVVNYSAGTLTLNTAPAINNELHILTLGVAAENILVIDTVIADGNTNEFVTTVEWRDNLSSFVNVNGVPSEIQLVQTGRKVAIRFPEAVEADAQIFYGIFYTEETNFSQVKKDFLVGDGSTSTFELSQAPFNQLPLSHKIVVQVDGQILNAGYNQKFAVTAVREYQLRLYQQPNVSLLPNQIEAYLNGTKLEETVDYRWDIFNTSITLFSGVGTTGDVLEVFVIDDGEYTFENNQVTFVSTPPLDSEIQITQFSNHDIQEIERVNYDVVERTTLQVGTEEYQEYHSLTTGLIKLRKPAIDAQYVWVTKNGVQLTPSVDYIVLEDNRYLKIKNVAEDDVLEIIHFSNPFVSKDSFGFRQFKDILNRTHYKRLNDNVLFELAQDLNWYDLRIEISDASELPVPSKQDNVPGVLFVNGERIEYFIKEGNTLRQIRRGTLGTGVPTVHPSGTKVENQSISENIPYKDEMISTVFEADGNTNTFQLDFTPESINDFEVFAAGKRLRKESLAVFDLTIDQDSPEGDVIQPAEFSLEGNTLTLLATPEENQKVIVVRKQGKIWTPLGESLSNVENNIGRFLRGATVDLPE